MESLYDITGEVLARQGIKAAEALGEGPISTLSRALVGGDNQLAFYVNQAGQLAGKDGGVVVAGNAVVDYATVANAAARLALTEVRNGDHVKDADTGYVYELVDESAIGVAGSWAKLRGMLAGDVVDSTAAGRAMLTAADVPAQLAALGCDGEIYIGAFMKSFTDARLVMGVSRDGRTWTLLNNGNPVYTVPGYVMGESHHVMRDPSIIYQASTGYFYIAHTAGNYGHSGYFSIIRSRDLRNWEHVKNVGDPTGSPVDSGTSWGPHLYQDTNGDIYCFVACDNTGLLDLKIYRTKASDSSNLAGTWSDFELVDMPNAGDDYYNEVYVYKNSASAMRMLVFNAELNRYEMLSASSITGAWTLVAAMAHAPREGVFMLELPNGNIRVYLTYSAGVPNSYQYTDFTADGVVVTPGLTPAVFYPSMELENGTAIRVRTPLAASFSTTALTGTMSEQNASKVSITGGTVAGVAITGALGVQAAPTYAIKATIHTAWTNGGFIGLAANGTTESWILGNGADNTLYWGLPTSGNGLSIWNAARSGQIAALSNGGNWSCLGTGTFSGAVSSGGTVTGTQVRVNGDSGWATGGIRFYTGTPGTASAFLGCFTTGQFAMRLGADGNGLVIYNSVASGIIARLTDSAVFQGGGLKIGGADGAGGTTVSRWKHGTGTLVAGTVTVSETTVTASSRIFLSVQSLGTVSAPKAVAVSARSAGVSFTITSADNTDTSVVAWQLVEP